MTETDICNKLLSLLGGPEAVEIFMTTPQRLLCGLVPDALLELGHAHVVAEVLHELEIRLR